MTTTLGKLCELVGGTCIGDQNLAINSANPLAEAGAHDVTFLENDKHLAEFLDGSAAAAVAPNGLNLGAKPGIHVGDPLNAFIAIVRFFLGSATADRTGIHPQACVDPTAVIGTDTDIAPFAVIGSRCTIGARCRIAAHVVVGADCKLGDDVTLFPQVVLYDRTQIGSRVTIHSHATIGADGFGYRFQNGRHEKIPQLGRVEIADDVEIGAATAIDRGTFSATRVGVGTKIDNLVMVGHNCQIGGHNIIVSQAGLAGSSGTGDYVVIAGQVGVVDHVYIGDRSVIGGQAAVTKDVPPGSRMLGSPATPERDQKRILMSLHHLPEFRRELREVQDRLGKAG